jgi:predicted small secreted protein
MRRILLLPAVVAIALGVGGCANNTLTGAGLGAAAGGRSGRSRPMPVGAR